MLETLIGTIKRKVGQRFSVTTIKVHTALNFFSNHIIDRCGGLADVGQAKGNSPRGKKKLSATADIEKLVEFLSKFHLFDPPADTARKSLSELPPGLIPADFELASQYVGVLDFTQPLSSLDTPALVAALTLAQELLERSGLVAAQSGKEATPTEVNQAGRGE
eukprot:4990075-Prymnesium_polylepis.1